MTDYIFYLGETEVEEPVGFSDIEISIKRDEKLHGMTFEAATSPLQFYGEAAELLKEEYRLNGVKANVSFSVEYRCEGNYDYMPLYSGRLNFGKYKASCGGVCMVSLPVEEESCQVILTARYDQKVDIDSLVAADGQTNLEDYEAISVETELPAHEMLQGIEGYVAAGESADIIPTNITTNNFVYVRPTYNDQRNESIQTGYLIPINNFEWLISEELFQSITPQMLFEDNIKCFDGSFEYSFRMKGSFSYPISLGSGAVRVKMKTWDGNGNLFDNGTTIQDVVVYVPSNGSAASDFDESFSGTLDLEEGIGVYIYLAFETVFQDGEEITINWDPETFVNIETVRSCPSTTAELSAVHETLSRVTESITNGCVKVKSEFYGRTDSEPYAFAQDGCGGLRTLTSGLKIRKAEEDKFFASLKDLIEGLNPIDNIGMGVEEDPAVSGNLLLRVEDVDFFYRNEQVLRHDYIPTATLEVEEQKHYSRILVGYKKWEVEQVKGLDEFNSNREYKTSIDTVSSTLDITSALVAGSYPIELTRQQSFAVSGGADTRYDNDIFIIAMERLGYPYGDLQVELGNITNPQNIFSPQTIYNYRLSPLRNLMRWYKSIGAAFASFFDTANKLMFSSGTGNLTASGIMESTFCRQESVDIQENQNIFVTHYANPEDYTPLWKNELLTYDYPMSVADYQAIKDNPYGYIESQCGTGEFEKFWIQEIKFKLTKGTATFILRKKYAV